MVRPTKNNSVLQDQRSSLIEKSQYQQIINKTKELREMLKTQYEIINGLQKILMQANQSDGTRFFGSVKATPVLTFSERNLVRTCEKLSGFFYSIWTYGKLCNYSDGRMLYIVLFFRDLAAICMTRLQKSGKVWEQGKDCQSLTSGLG